MSSKVEIKYFNMSPLSGRFISFPVCRIQKDSFVYNSLSPSDT